jgi:hypothetical protein
MKPVLAKTLFAVVLLTNLSTFAQGLNAQLSKSSGSVAKGGVATGGGDLCEDRIQGIRDDLKKWILVGGHQELTLPNGMLAKDYKAAMLEKIKTASIRCVGKGDAGYPVTVDGTPKVCRFDSNSSSDLITCDYQKFQAMTESDQYVLVHHEYAGLAEIELPDGAKSDYRVSNQISGSLEDQVVKKLVVKSRDNSTKQIPKDRLGDYKKSVNDAVGKYYICGKTRTLGDLILMAESATIKESGSFVSLMFTSTVYQLASGMTLPDYRIHLQVDFNGNASPGVLSIVEYYKEVNVGTIVNPKYVYKWVDKVTTHCEKY